jgi:hypothetical protein
VTRPNRRVFLTSAATGPGYMKIILTICAVVSTLCLVYFVFTSELRVCFLDSDNFFCRTVMSMMPDDPENVVLKRIEKSREH